MKSVERFARRRFGDVPTIYALADICRRELLVEIEGVAFSELIIEHVRFNQVD